MLALSGVVFIVASFITFYNMRELGDYTRQSCNSLGDSTLDATKRALTEQAKGELQSLVSEQAMITDLQLKRLSGELSVVCELAELFFQGLPTPARGANLKYLPAEKPNDIKRYSSWHAAGTKPSETELLKLSVLHPLFQFIYGNHDNIDQIFAGTPDGIYIGYPWNRQPDGYDPRQREWYKKAAARKGVVWYGPYVSSYGNKLVLSCARAVRDKAGKLLAVCGMDVTVNSITSDFISDQLAPGTTAFLLDAKGDVLAHKGMNSQGLNWNEQFATKNLFKIDRGLLRHVAVEMVAGRQGIEKFQEPGQPEVYVAYAPVKETGWSVGAFIESRQLIAAAKNTEITIGKTVRRHEENIQRFMRRSFDVYAITGALVLIGIFAGGMILSWRITSPILALKKKALEIGRGEWNCRETLHTGDELEQLDRTFGRMTADLKKYMEEIAETVKERERIEQEIAAAATIQQAMLPENFVPPAGLELAAFMRPARMVGGDFYDYFMLDAERMFFCIGEVSGEGVSAALLMARIKTLVSHEGTLNVSPEKILFNINNVLYRENDAHLFVTLTAGVLNVHNGELIFSNAGHPAPVLLENGNSRLLEIAPGIAVGPNPASQELFKLEKYQLPPSGLLLYYSDGITHAEDGQGGFFGEERLLECVTRGGKPQEVVERLVDEIGTFGGNDAQSDDVTIICFSIVGAEAWKS